MNHWLKSGRESYQSSQKIMRKTVTMVRLYLYLMENIWICLKSNRKNPSDRVKY